MKIYQIREKTNSEFSSYSSFCFLIETTEDTVTQWFFKDKAIGEDRSWIISNFFPDCIEKIYDKD